MRRIARAAIDIIRLTFARENLGDAGGSAPGPARQRSPRFLRMLFGIEPLPVDPPAPPRPRGAPLASLFAPEHLPEDPEPPAAPPPRLTLRSLLAPEPLPLDPVPPARRRPSRLAALFAPESLDDR